MAIPTGSGTEVIKYTKLTDLSNTNQTLITGVANHIYTIISIIWCEQGVANEQIMLHLNDSDGSTNRCMIFYGLDLPSESTFVWSDRFSFDGDKKLATGALATANIDVICTYIDQDWT